LDALASEDTAEFEHRPSKAKRPYGIVRLAPVCGRRSLAHRQRCLGEFGGFKLEAEYAGIALERSRVPLHELSARHLAPALQAAHELLEL